MSFDQALVESEDKVRHLLLGNGFSISADKTFSYSSLFEVAFANNNAPHLKKVFERLDTTDFEAVSRRLGQALEVAECYDHAEALADRIRSDLTQLRDALIKGLTAIHPLHKHVISDEAYDAVGKFLLRFRGRTDPALAGELYTTNYDLLLYWAIMSTARLKPNDGFGGKPLRWDPRGVDQCVFFLHGALHLYEDENEVTTKVTYTTSPLIKQIARKIEKGSLPLFVSEGTSAQKIERIQRSPYLRRASERFEAACNWDDTHLFIFGHALGDEDQHIVDAIREGVVARVCVSARNVDRVRVRYSALEAGWKESRRARGAPPVEIIVFPAAEAKVWG